MPVFERPPLETLTPAREPWTPLYPEHGRLEVDDSSIKWIGAYRTVLRIPVATLSVLMPGPGTTVTHAAIKACADCNTPICWVGAEGMRFYAFGTTPTHDNSQAQRGKALYAHLGNDYGVSWHGRNYNPERWGPANDINHAISAANASLYALTAAVVCSLGHVPQLGFVHSASTMPFVFDIADLYKPETTLPAAFGSVNRRTRQNILAYIRRNAPGLGLLVIAAASEGFLVEQFGQTERQHVHHCGLSLVAEKWDDDPETTPDEGNPGWIGRREAGEPPSSLHLGVL